VPKWNRTADVPTLSAVLAAAAGHQQRGAPAPHVDWRQTSPFLVIEIFGDDEEMVLVRSVKLLHQAPSIGKYWVIDIRNDPARPR